MSPAVPPVLHYVGCESVYDARAGVYHYCFWDLGHCVRLESSHRFRRGDLVRVRHVDAVKHVVYLEPVFEVGAESDRALVFLSPKIPLSAHSAYAYRADNLEVLHHREVELKGNKSYLTLVSAPVQSRSSLTFVEAVTGERFHYFLGQHARLEQHTASPPGA